MPGRWRAPRCDPRNVQDAAARAAMRHGAVEMTQVASKLATFVDLLRWRSDRQADQRALGFLTDGGPDELVLSYVAHDARPSVALTTEAMLSRVQGELNGVPWLATDATPGSVADAWQEPQLQP